jgi:suppressor of ftsI/bilirubin oxidase
VTISRRRLLRLAAAGTAASLLPASWSAIGDTVQGCATEGDFTQPLYVPGSDGLFARLSLAAEPLALHAAAIDDRLGFRAAYGVRRYVDPTLVVGSGSQVAIDLYNDLPEPTATHWHGLAVDTRNDGNGETLVAPGERYAYAFAVRNRAGLYWYHPHPHGATAQQTYRGLFGMLEVEDDEEIALRRALDVEPGGTELALVLQDLRGGDADRYAPAPEDELLGWYGCLPHVNGVLRPFHAVARRRYRLRILNAANARTFKLAFRGDDGKALPFALIGTDGGLLERPVACNEVLLSPAERIDIVVDFSDIAAGGFVVMESRAFAPMQDVRLPAADGDAAHGHRAAPGFLADGAAFDIMQFRVRGDKVASPAPPDRLSRLPAAAAPADERPLRLGFAKGRWRINDRVYDRDSTPIDVARGASETWLLRNYYTSAPHAMHLHGFSFRVLMRETSPDHVAGLAVDARGRLPTDLGAKDTVLVWPGESVRLAIDFRTPFPEPQIYLVHCHNLEHEDGGMMLRVRVG